jgi:hypothetical protein
VEQKVEDQIVLGNEIVVVIVVPVDMERVGIVYVLPNTVAVLRVGEQVDPTQAEA